MRLVEHLIKCVACSTIPLVGAALETTAGGKASVRYQEVVLGCHGLGNQESDLPLSWYTL